MSLHGKQIKERVFKRDGGRCKRCNAVLYLNREDKSPGKKKAHLHHVIPKSKGGSNDADNLLLTCWKCTWWARIRSRSAGHLRRL